MRPDFRRLMGANPNIVEAAARRIPISVKDNQDDFIGVRQEGFRDKSYVDKNGREYPYESNPFYIDAGDLHVVKDIARIYAGPEGIHLEPHPVGGNRNRKQSRKKTKRSGTRKKFSR